MINCEIVVWSWHVEGKNKQAKRQELLETFSRSKKNKNKTHTNCGGSDGGVAQYYVQLLYTPDLPGDITSW